METITIKKPSECSPQELNDFSAFVAKHGQVEKDVLRDRIEGALCLVQLIRDCALIGTAALKSPSAGSRGTAANGAGVELDEKRLPYELGYVAVAAPEEGKDFSHCLVAAALTRAEKKGVYATTDVKRIAMQTALKARSFVEVGNAYKSTQHPSESLCLFISEARKARKRATTGTRPYA